ncbi:era [Symbiodinium necroappetens]|uniref:Era protein n=1 Tax=Symbiodinium necroappetens TaxID=1628268 RepID=A0A813BHM6_9DINO|nr:era [Symbiodinium necroappetens]
MAPLAAVMMGKSGVGKTTFYNLLCETDHAAEYSSKSLTRQLFRSDVTHGQQVFSVIDTPGVDSADEVLKHSVLLHAALTNGPVNAIFVMVEYNSRCDSALDEFDRAIRILKPDYHNMVVVVIAKFDNAPPRHVTQIQEDYKEAFRSEGFPRLMFYSSNQSAREVAVAMIEFMKAQHPKTLQYTDQEFLKFFRVADETRAQKKAVQKHIEEIDSIISSYVDLVPTVCQEPDRDEIILSAIAACRYDVDKVYEQFNQEHGSNMIDMDCYTQSIQLQKAIDMKQRSFTTKAKEYMSYNPDDAKDWRNFVRKCVHCDEVWVKVSGCNGVTQCGNREKSQDVSDKPWYKYSFEMLADGRRMLLRNNACDRRSSTKSASSSGKHRGCGKDINWSELPRLTDAEMQTLYEVKGLQEVLTGMQQHAGHKDMKAYRDKVDTSFTK